MKNETTAGHLAALLTILLWGTTFISTKLLLEAFQPVEILLLRFVIGFAALFLACPRLLGVVGWAREKYFMGAGLTGICLYYLLENIALDKGLASHVGVIVSTAPFFTALLIRLLWPQEGALRPSFFAGLAVALAGVALIGLNGTQLRLDPVGDLLALLAAAVWAVYSALVRKIGTFGYATILTTRRIFFWGILFMLPALALFDCAWDMGRLARPVYLGNLLFLGLGASAMCFVTWNFAVKVLGAVKTSVYIYLVPVITVAASALILQEAITPMAALGTALTLAGLFLSEWKSGEKKS